MKIAQPAENRDLLHYIDLIFLILVALFLHVGLAWQMGQVGDGGLADTDAYMRLIRIEDLWRTGDWFNTITPALGAPDGLSLHWTRPLDVLILLPAMLLHAVGLSMKASLYWAGAAASPIFHILACIAAAWAAKPLWPDGRAWRLAPLMLLLNGAALGYSIFARPDHHSLILLLTVLGAAWTIRALLAPDGGRAAHVAGAIAGLGIWVSPEILLNVAPALVAFGLLWLIEADGSRWARVGRRYALGMAVTILLAVLVEHPPQDWLRAEYDKVSVLHLSVAGLAVLDFALVERLPGRRPASALLAGAIAAVSAGLLALVFPGFFMGPLGMVDERSMSVFIGSIQEMQPLWPANGARAKSFLDFIGNSQFALAILPFCFLAWRRSQLAAPGFFLALSYMVALIGALMHLRLAVQLSAFGAILGCGFLSVLDRLATGRPELIRILPRLAMIAALAAGPQILTMAIRSGVQQTAPACRAKPVADWLNANLPVDRSTPWLAPIIMTESVNFPPELAYRTGYRFVGGPYHRGVGDVADMMGAFQSEDLSKSRGIFARRQANFALLCATQVPGKAEDWPKNSLYYRLRDGRIPDWLVPVPMNPEAGKEFRLFKVMP